LVIKDRLVKTCIHILRLISDKNLNINKIIKQTSSDRTHVIEAIKTLERAKLVKRRKSESHKEMEFLVLAQMGSDLVNFMNSIDGFRKSFQSLTKTIDEYFNLDEHYVIMREVHRMLPEEEKTGITQKPSEELRASEKSLRNKLRARNWTDDEIGSHYYSAGEADKFHLGSARAFIMGLFNKYLSLSLRYGSSEISRAILIRKIIDSLNQHLADVYKHLHHVMNLTHDKDLESTYVWLVFSFNRQIYDYLKDFSEDERVRTNLRGPPTTFDFVPRIKNRFLEKEVTDVMRSIANMYEFDSRWASEH
jgi:DNA-binding transcriptional regulator GbsR (MarR family)